MRIWFLAVVVLACMIDTAALTSVHSAGTIEDRLIIITPHWEGIRKEYEAGFKRWLRATKKINVDVKFDWLNQGSSDILRQIDSDFQAQRPTKIDIVFGGGLENFTRFKERGYLQKATIAATKQIPSELRGVPLKDKDDAWYGAALSAFGIMYNKRVLAKERLPRPKDWSDLARPEFRGRVGAADPRHSGSFLLMCEIMLQANGWDRGWEIITGMMGNARSVSQGSFQLPHDIARGDIAVGAVIDFYARQEISQAQDGDKVMGYAVPQMQTVISPDPIAMLKNAPHRQAALLFMEYVLTDGQKLLVLPKGSKEGPQRFTLGRLTVLPRLYSTKGIEKTIGNINPFKVTKSLNYNEETGSARRKVLGDLIGTLLVDNRRQLQSAWAKVKPGQKYAALAKPPVTEAEAMALAKKWDAAAFRNETLAKWTLFARAKYQKF